MIMKINNLFVRFIFCLFFLIWTASSFADIDLKIMSFNLQQPYGTNWDGRKVSVKTIINNESPDIVGSQEAVNYMRDYITQQTGYAVYGSGRDGGDEGEASFIFYKGDKYTLDAANSGNFWLSYTPNSPSKIGGLYNRVCTYVRLIEKSSNQAFYVFNVHNYMPGESDYRLAAAKILVQHIADRAIKDPVFLTGDFNSSEGDAVTIWMKSGNDNSIKFRDSYRDVDPSGYVTTGFETKFDYIYLPNTTQYSCSESWVVKNPAGASDHMPIVALVRYSGTPTVSETVSFNNLSTTLVSDQSYQVSVNYTASTDRDVVVCMYDNTGNWTVIGEVSKSVSAGSGTLEFIIPVFPTPTPGNGYIFKCDIRPVGAAWDAYKAMQLAENITITLNDSEIDYSSCNQISDIGAVVEYYAPDWVPITTGAASVFDGTCTFDFPTGTSDVWMTQPKITAQGGINLNIGVNYTFSCTITSNTAINGAIVKIESAGGEEFGETVVNLSAGIPYKLKASGDGVAMTGGYIIMGVGGHATNTTITVSNINLRESACAGLVTDVQENLISVYPNPVQQSLFFLSDEIVAYDIYDSKGLRILHGKGTSVDVSVLSKGIYYIAIGKKTHRFIKI